MVFLVLHYQKCTVLSHHLLSSTNLGVTNFEDFTLDDAAFFLRPGFPVWFQITGLNLLCDIWAHGRLFPGISKIQRIRVLQSTPCCKVIVCLVIKVATQTTHFALEKKMELKKMEFLNIPWKWETGSGKVRAKHWHEKWQITVSVNDDFHLYCLIICTGNKFLFVHPQQIIQLPCLPSLKSIISGVLPYLCLHIQFKTLKSVQASYSWEELFILHSSKFIITHLLICLR